MSNGIIQRLASNLAAVQKQEGLDAVRIYQYIPKVSGYWGNIRTQTWREACLMSFGQFPSNTIGASLHLGRDLKRLDSVDAVSAQSIYDVLYVAQSDMTGDEYMTWWRAAWDVIVDNGEAANQSTRTQRREQNRALLENRFAELGQLLVKDTDFYFRFDGGAQLGPWPEDQTAPSSTDSTQTLPMPGIVAP